MKIGDRVTVGKRWLRSYQAGQIIDCEPRRHNCWLVKFDSSYPGGGIDGDSLWLSDLDIRKVDK